MSNYLEYSKVVNTLGRPVTYFPNISKAFGDIRTGIFLSNFMYWEGKQVDVDGWIYKTQVEIYNETGLERRGQEYARKKLKEVGILKEKKAGIPAKTYYQFNWDQVDKFLCEYFDKNPKNRNKSKKKTPKEKGEVVDLKNIVYEMSVIFNEIYKAANDGMGYQFTKDKEGGKDWGGLKRLSETFKDRGIEKKQYDAKNLGSGETKFEISDVEILNSFKHFMFMLPKYHLERNLTPQLLYSNFSKIITDIKSDRKKSNSKEPKSTVSDYV